MRLDADGSVHALQVAVLDVLLDPLADVEERLLLCVAASGRLGLRADACDDLARLLEDVPAVEVVEVPAGGAGLLGELVLLLVEGWERVAEEDTAHALGRALATAEDRPGVASQARLQLRVGLEQRLVFEVHFLHRGARALVGMVELLQCLVIVLRGEELPSLDAEGF